MESTWGVTQVDVLTHAALFYDSVLKCCAKRLWIIVSLVMAVRKTLINPSCKMEKNWMEKKKKPSFHCDFCFKSDIYLPLMLFHCSKLMWKSKVPSVSLCMWTWSADAEGHMAVVFNSFPPSWLVLICSILNRRVDKEAWPSRYRCDAKASVLITEASGSMIADCSGF